MPNRKPKKNLSFLYLRKAPSLPFHMKLGRRLGGGRYFSELEPPSKAPAQCLLGVWWRAPPRGLRKVAHTAPPSSHEVLVLGFGLGMLCPWLTTDLPQESQNRILIPPELKEEEGGR